MMTTFRQAQGWPELDEGPMWLITVESFNVLVR
jgi:hypothetical protein